MNSSSANTVLELLRRLPPNERLKVIAQALPELEKELSGPPKQRKQLLGLFADSGSAPSEEQINEARQKAWKNFPREDL